MYALKINNLIKMYGHVKVLDNFSITVKKGEIYGLVGANGSGKTTLFRIIAGLTSKNSGEINISNCIEKSIGFTIEAPAIYGNMSVHENIKAHCLLCGVSSMERSDTILKTIGLYEHKDKKTKKLSYGMKQRLALGIALLDKPKMLILDEPTNGLDPIAIIELRKLLIKLSENGMTILIASHMLSELTHLATRYGFIHEGKILKEISSDELINKGDLETYFINIIQGGAYE